MMDLLDFSKRRAQPGGHKYLLTVIDIFSRFLWVERLTDRTDVQVVAALRKVVRRNSGAAPLEISSDGGGEFSGPRLTAYLTDTGITNRKADKSSGINSLSGIDRAQQSLKQIIGNLQSGSDAPWSTLVKKGVDIYNDREHSGLMGEAPSTVTENKPMMYLLEKEAGEAVAHNNKLWRKKAGKVSDLGGFRLPLAISEWPRIDQPKYEGKVHKVTGLKGAHVESAQGSYPVRKVLAVPADSQSIVLNDETIPNSGLRERQRVALRQFSEQLKRELAQTPQNQMSFARATRFLRNLASFTDTADVYRLPKEARYVKFFRLYGFRLEGSGPAMVVKPPTPSVGQAPAPRAAQLAPRAPRRDLPGTQGLIFQPDNPKRGTSQAFIRYEMYKGATTVAEVRRLGMNPQDLREAIRQGHAQLT